MSSRPQRTITTSHKIYGAQYTNRCAQRSVKCGARAYIQKSAPTAMKIHASLEERQAALVQPVIHLVHFLLHTFAILLQGRCTPRHHYTAACCKEHNSTRQRCFIILDPKRRGQMFAKKTGMLSLVTRWFIQALVRICLFSSLVLTLIVLMWRIG